ncbi:structural maintenance of chromosome 1 [Nematocida minor]|uniref:structural maintenance of chromosome 1 n=1 Tax=Nematocida minor TaxID=1912983 RepID=UPI00221E77A5|nr:structural maintenance of chromosome 1 [Nematocida minor]KAI5189879.1 structural maintenance of chromosome 1 [Nematocida minor]
MSIVNLKILSFKTYSKAECIPFSPFTCIVGPNGAGKSNLVDALLFVLGASPSEIRGTLPARDSPPPTAVELSFREKSGVVTRIKRELVNEASFFYIEETKVSQSDYYAYLESQNISTVHRNFLISQNESLIKSPKDLTKFIDKISGSSLLKSEYKDLKQQKDTLTKEYHEIVERKRTAETSAKEYEQVVSMQTKHRSLISRRRILASSKIKKRRILIRDAKRDLQDRLAAIEEKTEGSTSQKIHKEMADIQTSLIKARAARAGAKQQQDIKMRKKEQEARDIESLHEEEMKLQEKISEAQAQIDDCAWAISKAESLSKSHPAWNEHYQREILIRTLTQIQRIEDSKSILQLRLAVNELKREIKETEQQEREEKEMEAEEENSNTRLSQLNQSLLESLKALSSRVSRVKEAEYSSRLGYLINRIKSTIPQVIGRVTDLISAADQKYSSAIHALLYAKRNTIIIEQEKHVLPILNGLSQSGAGRVTILPLNRLNIGYNSKDIGDENNPSAGRNSDVPSGYIRCRDVIQLSREVQGESEKIISYACGNALIYLGEGSPEYTKEKVVTLDGIVISKDGMVRKISMQNDAQEIRELENRRDRILEEIKIENQRTVASNERTSITYKKSSKVVEMEKRLEDAQKELEEAESDIKEQVEKIAENAGLPMEIVKQAKDQGIVDSSSSDRKLLQIKRKEVSWKNRLEDLTAQLQNLQESIPKERGETEVESEKESTAELDEEIKALEDALLELSKKLEPSLEIETKVIKEQIVLLDDEIEEIEQYMAEEGLTEETISEAPTNTAEDDLDKLEREIGAVSKFLSQKGSVVETHQLYVQLEKEAEERKNILNEVVRQFQKIKKERASLFLGIFDKINALINKHYARLTDNPSGHVRAHLGLENPLEPYLAGTQIFVMPTGKTFREAKYLSGGEKTMVAISLLLSIDALYPSLFYIFDELDAALDKDKISSLRESLQEINAQFIAVTHRLELFETADTLIGVAKPPKGHSQIFTLKL